MKVLQINSFYYLGGSTGKIASDLFEAIKSDGDYSYIIYGINNGEENGDGIFLLEDKLYRKLNGLKSRMFSSNGFNNVIATKKAIDIIDYVKPDVIHIHNLHGAYINIELLFAYIRDKSIPVVWTLHDCWAYTGRCAYYDYNQCFRWTEGCAKCEFPFQYPKTWGKGKEAYYYNIKKSLYSNYSNLTFVTPSRWLIEEMDKSFLRSSRKIVINNGIDLNVFYPQGCEKKNGYSIKKMVLAVAYNWSDQKGYRYLRQIAKELDDEWKLVVIGDKQKKNRELIKQGVIVIEKISDGHELAKWYSSADVLINPTLEDNFPTVLIEAMACGTPCISFNTGGCSEIIGETGAVVNRRDWRAMLESIYNIDKEKLKDKCIERVQKNYNKREMIEKYIELYHEMYRQKDE